MAKITSKIALPIILVGLFALTVFISISYESLTVSFYLIFVLVVLFAFSFGFATGQSVATPMKKILNRAMDLSKGDLKSRVYLEERKDEISDLAQVFNKIADELEKSKLETEEKEKSVDIRVRAKTRALEEKITGLEQKIKNKTIELQKLSEDLKNIQRGKKPG